MEVQTRNIKLHPLQMVVATTLIGYGYGYSTIGMLVLVDCWSLLRSGMNIEFIPDDVRSVQKVIFVVHSIAIW